MFSHLSQNLFKLLIYWPRVQLGYSLLRLDLLNLTGCSQTKKKSLRFQLEGRLNKVLITNFQFQIPKFLYDLQISSTIKTRRCIHGCGWQRRESSKWTIRGFSFVLPSPSFSTLLIGQLAASETKRWTYTAETY